MIYKVAMSHNVNFKTQFARIKLAQNTHISSFWFSRFFLILSLRLCRGNNQQLFDTNMTESSVKTFSLAEIAEHNSNSSSWVVIHNNIYDVTAFLNEVRIQLWFVFLFNLFVCALRWDGNWSKVIRHRCRQVNINVDDIEKGKCTCPNYLFRVFLCVWQRVSASLSRSRLTAHVRNCRHSIAISSLLRNDWWIESFTFPSQEQWQRQWWL